MNKKTFKQWFALMVLLLVGTMGTQAQSLKVADFIVTPGEQTDVTINLDLGQLEAVYGVQTDLILPTGLTLVGDPAVADGVMADEATAPTLSYNAANGRITLFSQASKAITESGPVVKLTLAAAADFAGGELKLTGSRLTTSIQAGETTVGDCTAQAKIPVVEANYTVDFNTTISTTDHAFAVASNWGHIVDYLEYDNYGTEYAYVTYTYSSTGGAEGTGALGAYSQNLTASYSSDSKTAYDLLVTPLVSGRITIDVKAMNYSDASIEIYALTDNGKAKGDLIKSVTRADLSTDDYTTINFTLAQEQKVGIRLSHVYMDNFTAENATILPEPKLTITAVTKATDESTVYYKQQPDGTLLVEMNVTLQNNGEVDFVAGETDGYTLSVLQDYYGTKYGPFGAFAIPVDLAIGQTSEPFLVQVYVPADQVSSLRSWGNWYVVENVTSTQSAAYVYAGMTTYEPKFVFRVAETTTTTSISAAEAWGTITESTTKTFEIYNDGTAPLVIKSITLPEGFTSADAPEIPAEGLTIASKASQALSITQDATAYGTFSGTLTIVYVDKNGNDATYTLDFSATYVNPNTWRADFNNTTSTIVYPAGAVAEGGINSDYQYISSGNYNNWIKGRTSSMYTTENNKFITPKLHAAAGDQLAFDVLGAYGSTYYAKVYVSTDRKNWGEPVATYTYGETEGAEAVGSGTWVTKTIDFAEEGDYYVAFALYGEFAIDNLIGLEKVAVTHDLYFKEVTLPVTAKTGTAISPKIVVIPMVSEAASNYTVSYYVDGEVAATADAAQLTASATTTTDFSFSYTPADEATTIHTTYIAFEFTDGTVIKTDEQELQVLAEATFSFITPSTYVGTWDAPTSVSAPIAFGKVNELNLTKQYRIYNWGSAPLTINSIELPEGFTAVVTKGGEAFDITTSTIAVKDSVSVQIVFSATETGTYSGNMVINHSGVVINDDRGAQGKESPFTLPISGTLLDPTLFYANFGTESNQWPAGSVYQSNVSTTYVAAGDYAITSSSSTGNLFITPKLTAAAGDKLLFDAKLYSTIWSEGKVVVYAAATRDELINFDPEADTRTPLFSVSGEDETNPMTTNYQTFEVPAVAGDNYYAFEISGRPYVDELYGLKVTEVAHDWMIASSSIPTEGMQNQPSTATVNILNLGVQDEAAESYDVVVYVDGEATTTTGSVALPMTHQLSNAGTQVSTTFRSPKAGTFPVYIEVKAGDYSVQTEPVDVTFAEEELKGDATAEADGASNYAPLNLSYYNSESVSLYTSDVLANSYGLVNGAKIKSITYKGYKTTDPTTSTLNVWYEWTDDATQAQPASGLYATEGMTQLVTDESKTWETKGSATALEDFIVLNFTEPLVYEEGKSLRIVVRSNSDQWKQAYFEKGTSATSGLTYYHYNDTKSTFESNSWSSTVLPVLHFGLEATATTIAGTVKDAAGAAIENATVTLVSTDGDNIQYTGTTDAEGAYTINVIQATRTYNVTATAEGYQDQVEENVSFAEGNVTKDFVLTKAPEKGDANGDGEISTADAVAVVNIALSEDEPTAEQLAVADMNGDGVITTADAVAIVQLALQQEATAGARRVDLSAQNRLSVNGSVVKLDNADEFVAFQMDVTLADDAQLQGVQLSDRLTSHEVAYARVDANTWRIAVFSLQNDAIMHNNGQLLQLQVSGTQQVALSNVEFATADARACAVALGEATGISAVGTQQADADYYNVGGVRSNQMHKGMNIVVDRNGQASKVLRK